MRKHYHRNRAGSTLMFVVVCLSGLLAFAALSVDLGNVFAQRKYIQEGADAAAMAAVQEWAVNVDSAQTVATGTTYARTNGLGITEIESITPGVWNSTSTNFTANTTTFAANAVPAVQVVAGRAVPTAFWNAFTFGSHSSMHPRVQSIAIAARATAVAGILPWAICNDGTSMTKCDTLTVKNGSDCSSPGNYGVLNLTPDGSHGGGANNYKDNIINGFPNTVRVGDHFYPETGDMVGPTKDGLKTRLAGVPPYTCTATSKLPTNARLVILPYTTALGSGASDPVTVIGFYVVALGDPDNKGQVTATFLEAFGGTEVDPTTPPTPGLLNGTALVK